MFRFAFIYAVFFSLICCDSKKTTESSDIKTNSAQKINKEEINKRPVNGVDSSMITCNCPEPYNGAAVQYKIAYPKNYVKLCSWRWDKVTKDINEFQVFDHNDNLIFEGYPPSEYQIIELNQPLTIRQFTSLPNDQGNWQLNPVFDFEFTQSNTAYRIDSNFILKPIKMNEIAQDSILQIFLNQSEHLNKYDVNAPPLASEKYILGLFQCSINGNDKCLDAFEKLNTRFVTDGAIGELYNELLGIVRHAN